MVELKLTCYSWFAICNHFEGPIQSDQSKVV